MVVIAYIFTVINYICYCVSRYCKSKSQMVSLDLLAKLSSIIALILLNSLTGGFNMSVSIVLLIVIKIREKKELPMKLNTILFVLFCVLYIVILVFTYNGLSSMLSFITSMLILIGLWYLKPQGMRMIGIAASLFCLSYMISISNWAGLLEILVLFSNISSYLYYRKGNKK